MKKQLIALSLATAMLTTAVFAAPSPWVTAELDTVPTGDWAYQAPITYGQLLTLYPEAVTALDTDTPMTREQVAVALTGAMDLDFYYQVPNYTDVTDISPEAIFAVGQLQTAGIMNGYANGHFDPQGACTVEQAMVVLSRLATATSNVAIYNADGMAVAIPTAIQDQLLINPHDLTSNTLIKVYETASYSQSQADFGGEYGMGFLFAIKRYTQAEYEQHLYYDMAGHSVFAKDDTYYYAKQEATDVQFYRSDMADYTDEALDEWTGLLDAPNDIINDFILRNGLTPYDETAERDIWGITLTATDVTPTGMTLLCTQVGGAQQGQLQTGTPYCLELYQDGAWETVDYLPQEHNIAWTTIAWIIPENQTTEWAVDWDWLYGTLPSGTYRIGKSVMDFIGTGTYEEQMYYAVFDLP